MVASRVLIRRSTMAKKTQVKSEVASLVEIKPFTSGRVLTETPEKLSLVEQIQAHVLLKKVKDAVETRLADLRVPLMAVAQANGEVVSEKGTKKYVVDGNSVCVEYRKANAPAEDKVREMLTAKGIPLTEVFDEVKVLSFNPSKLDYLVQTGKVSQADFEAAIPAPSPALRIYPSKELKSAVEALGLKSKPKEEDAPQASFESGEKKS